MPIKQVVCSVCKETVNKAVTYHVGGTDRACRKHEGVDAKKEALDAEKQEKQQRSVQKLERRREPVWSEPSEAMKPKCWVCMNTGLRSQEFFLRYLVECEKQSKITGKTVIPLFNNSVKLKERCIFTLPKDKCLAALKYVRDDFRNLVEIAGVIAICGDCCRFNKIDPLPKVEWEDLMKITPISELVIRPAIEAMAAQELARDN
jgi:hypothetical protein